MVEVIPERCVPIAKRELLYLGTVGWACWLSGIIFIDRHRRDAAIEVISRTASTMWRENVRKPGLGGGKHPRGEGVWAGLTWLRPGVTSVPVPAAPSVGFPGRHQEPGQIHAALQAGGFPPGRAGPGKSILVVSQRLHSMVSEAFSKMIPPLWLSLDGVGWDEPWGRGRGGLIPTDAGIWPQGWTRCCAGPGRDRQELGSHLGRALLGGRP